VWAFKLVESAGNAETGERRLKTRNAARILPLHPELIRLGFLEYVESIAARPDAPLFPDLEPQGPDRKRGPRLTRWFVHYRRTIGVYREGVAMHAFRHTARTRLSDATEGTRERHLNCLFGHAGGGSEGATRYDKGPACAPSQRLWLS
jgi:integrase